jgi:hypothetical protein
MLPHDKPSAEMFNDDFIAFADAWRQRQTPLFPATSSRVHDHGVVRAELPLLGLRRSRERIAYEGAILTLPQLKSSKDLFSIFLLPLQTRDDLLPFANEPQAASVT